MNAEDNRWQRRGVESLITSVAISLAAAIILGMMAKPAIREYVGGLPGTLVLSTFLTVLLGNFNCFRHGVNRSAPVTGFAWLVIGFWIVARCYEGS